MTVTPAGLYFLVIFYYLPCLSTVQVSITFYVSLQVDTPFTTPDACLSPSYVGEIRGNDTKIKEISFYP